MILARTGRALLVAAFLVAQAVALGHQLWHAAPPGVKVLASDSGLAGQKNPLCDFHGVLDAVLGLLAGVPPATPLAAVSEIVLVAAASPAAPLFAPVPQSRGPPALL